MLRLLYYGESPMNPTGFGQVNKHILAALSRVASVRLVASSHYYGSYDRELYPYEIVACTDPDDARNLTAIEPAIKSGEWDIFFYQGDIGANDNVLEWVREQTVADKQKYSVFYMPVDTDTATGGSFLPFLWASAPVVYTHHAKGVIERYAPDIAKLVSVIWLGCEIEAFYPLSNEERMAARLEIFGERYQNRFLVLNVNRNQVRKDLARCMSAFHLFHERHPDATLYMHSVQDDVAGHLPTQAYFAGCDIWGRENPEIAFSDLNLSNPCTREFLNKLYNACDVLVSTSYGEGWGLSTSEGMCAGLPVLVPGNTANLDIIGANQERGWLIKTGGDLDHTTFVYSHGGRPSSFIHAESFVSQLEYIYTHRDVVDLKAAGARLWCEQNSWAKREAEWERLIHTIEEHLSPVSQARMAHI